MASTPRPNGGHHLTQLTLATAESATAPAAGTATPVPAPTPAIRFGGPLMDPQLLQYYEAIEHASADMLEAARDGRWDDVLKLESACVLLISQLKHAAQGPADLQPAVADPVELAPRTPHPAAAAAARTKSRIMQRILVNDAEIRHLAEPWLQDLEQTLAGRNPTLH